MSLLAKDLSILIPVAEGEAEHLNLLKQLAGFLGDSEIIISAPFSQPLDKLPLKVKWVVSEKGRAKQLNNASRNASGKTLLFLHADSKISKLAFDKLLEQYLPNTLNYFDLHFDGKNPLLRMNECGVSIRSRLLGIPFGDQGFCVSKKIFDALGGFNESAAYGEDHLFVWTARKHKIPTHRISAALITSSRKYKKNGWVKTTLNHVYLTLRQAIEAQKDKGE